MSFPGYESYCSSGVEWLGNIPSHWALPKLKSLAVFSGGGTPSREKPEFWGGHIPWVSPKDMKAEALTDAEEHITELGLASSASSLVECGTIMLVVRSGILRHTIPVAKNLVPIALNQDMKALRFGPECLPNFFLRWVQGLNDQLIHVWLKQGATVESIEHAYLADTIVPLPPIEEQIAIVAFLDRETAKIDALVEAQRRLIELLKEKRQAVISHAVTKGLNPNAPMKDSGIEWLGEVPAHWRISPLMWLTAPGRAIMYGIVLPGPDVGQGVPIVKGGDVKPERLKLELLNWTTPEIEEPYARARLLPEDIVYSIRGSIGDAEPVPLELTDANITQDVARISPRKDVNSRWLLYAMRSRPVFVQLEQRSLGAAVRGINIFDLKRARIPVPPPHEQAQIAAFLDEQGAKFNGLIAEAEAAIPLLQERRSALISATVTGKIDVRAVGSRKEASLNRPSLRLVVGAAIVEAVANKPNSGRTKPHKLLYLAEAHAAIPELEGHYLREAAGPLDRAMLEDVENQLRKIGHISVSQPGGPGTQVTYKVTGKRGAFRAELAAALGPRMSAFGQLIANLADLDTRHVEAVATLYAVWNDALIEGKKPTDTELISAFLNDWHPEKRMKFRADELKTWLGWMRRHSLVPRGTGTKTQTGRLFA